MSCTRAYVMPDGSMVDHHNTVPIKGFRRFRRWYCIYCHETFAERPDFIDPVLPLEIERNEHGAWIGCKSVYVIEEQP